MELHVSCMELFQGDCGACMLLDMAVIYGQLIAWEAWCRNFLCFQLARVQTCRGCCQQALHPSSVHGLVQVEVPLGCVAPTQTHAPRAHTQLWKLPCTEALTATSSRCRWLLEQRHLGRQLGSSTVRESCRVLVEVGGCHLQQ